MSRILVIDDELSIRRMLQVLLQGAGHTMISADDGSHGLHVLALEKPDLLILDLGLLTIDLGTHEARVSEQTVPLTPIEFALLAQLALHAGRVLTHAHLLYAVWGPKAAEQSHYLRVHFTHLRRKLRSAGLPGEVIRNEPGIAYRFLLGST